MVPNTTPTHSLPHGHATQTPTPPQPTRRRTAVPQYVLQSEGVDTVLHFAAQTHVDASYFTSLAFTRDNTCDSGLGGRRRVQAAPMLPSAPPCLSQERALLCREVDCPPPA